MTDINCVSGVELLMEYLEGELPADTHAAITAHVSGCARCEAFIESYQATPRIFREATLETMPEELQASLLAAVRAERARG
jgi:anti-sigma factor RsiW